MCNFIFLSPFRVGGGAWVEHVRAPVVDTYFVNIYVSNKTNVRMHFYDSSMLYVFQSYQFQALLVILQAA